MIDHKYSLKCLLSESYTPDSEPRPYEGGYFDPRTALMYTIKRVEDLGKPGGEVLDKNRMHSLPLKDGVELTPEILVDFWYYDHRFTPKKAAAWYPVSVEILSGKQPNPREGTGEIYDLTSVADNPRQA